MTRAIWKYPFLILKEQTINMPSDAQVLTIAAQDGGFVLWALVTPEAPSTPRTFSLYGTGWELPDTPIGRHLATLIDGPFVWHIFEPNRSGQARSEVPREGGVVRQAIIDEIAFLESLAARLDDWAKASWEGGWSTHQVSANHEAANDCRRRAAVLSRALQT